MSNASIAAEVHKIEETVKEELIKASMHLRGEFQQQLNMERQDRQDMLAKVRRDIEQQRSAILMVTEKLDAFPHSDQISEQQEAIQRFDSQQHTMEKISQDNELFALKMSAAETTIAELQKAIAGQATILENVNLEVGRQSAVHAEIIQQHMEVGIQNDQVQELRRECNSQRLQLVDQSSKSTAIAAESETLRLRVSAVESSLEDIQRASGARSPQDLSMQSELHSHVVALKETVAQLRSDVAVQSSMNTDYLLQQAGLESLRKEVSKLKLCTTPAAMTMNVSLEQSIQKLREDMEKKFTVLEQQTHIEMASTIADILSKRFADNMHKAERMDKLVEDGQPTKFASIDGNQEMQESKERDVSCKNCVSAGEWSAAKEATLEEMSKHGSDTSSSVHPLPAPEGISSTDPHLLSDLKKSLTTLVDSIQSNLKISGGGSADIQSRGVPSYLSRRKAESANFPNQSQMQASSSVQSDASLDRRPNCSSPRTPTSVPPGTSQNTSVSVERLHGSSASVERLHSSSVSVPHTLTASVSSRSASRPERTVLGTGKQADNGLRPGSPPAGSHSPQAPRPNKDLGRTNQFAGRKASLSPQGVSRSHAYGGGGQHRVVSPVSAGGLPGPTSANQPSLVVAATSALRSSSGNFSTSPPSVTSSLEGSPASKMTIPQRRPGGPAFGGSNRCQVQSQPTTQSSSKIIM